MPLPSSIPTSFVPHPSGQSNRPFRSDFSSALSIFAYVLLVIALLGALGVFLYGRVLVSQREAKDTQLAQAQAGIDMAAVQNFVRLRDRLSASEGLLNHHVAISNFFTLLEQILPASTRFTSLHLVTDAKGVVSLQGAGVAQSFNALAAASNAFAKDGRIKDAIFSNISVGNTGAVSFKLVATLDQNLLSYVPAAPAPAVVEPTATGTPLSGMSTSTATTTP